MQDDEIEPAPARRPAYLRFLSIAVSGILIAGGGVIMYRWISGPEILDTLRRLDWRWLVPALLAYWLQYPITALRMDRVMHWLMRPGSPLPPPLRLITKVTLSAGFVSVTAPMGMIADAVKIGALKYFGQISTSQAIRATLFDRVVAAQWLALFALASLPIQWGLGLPLSSIGVEFIVAASFVIGIGVLLLLPNVLKIFGHQFILKLAHLFTGYGAMLPPRRSAIQMVIAGINLFLVFITIYCILRAIGLSAHLVVIACFLPFLQLVNNVPFLYMGWGGREIAMTMAVGPASGLSLNQALVVSATWGLTVILAGAVNGVFMLGDWQSHRAQAPAPEPIGGSAAHRLTSRDRDAEKARQKTRDAP